MDIFSHIFVVKTVMFALKDNIKRKRCWGWPIKKRFSGESHRAISLSLSLSLPIPSSFFDQEFTDILPKRLPPSLPKAVNEKQIKMDPPFG